MTGPKITNGFSISYFLANLASIQRGSQKHFSIVGQKFDFRLRTPLRKFQQWIFWPSEIGRCFCPSTRRRRIDYYSTASDPLAEGMVGSSAKKELSSTIWSRSGAYGVVASFRDGEEKCAVKKVLQLLAAKSDDFETQTNRLVMHAVFFSFCYASIVTSHFPSSRRRKGRGNA